MPRTLLATCLFALLTAASAGASEHAFGLTGGLSHHDGNPGGHLGLHATEMVGTRTAATVHGAFYARDQHRSGNGTYGFLAWLDLRHEVLPRVQVIGGSGVRQDHRLGLMPMVGLGYRLDRATVSVALHGYWSPSYVTRRPELFLRAEFPLRTGSSPTGREQDRRPARNRF
jgi:hypothetical protein